MTLAEVLEARGSPLDEDEVWCLLLATTGALLDISRKGKHSSVFISPIFFLLSQCKGSFVRQNLRAPKTIILKQQELHNPELQSRSI